MDERREAIAIQVKNVGHHYGARPVLQDVSLRIGAGELIALVGPNGMGKTTLLAVMSGLLAPIKGEVFIDGLRRRESEEIELQIRRRVAYLPADPWLPARNTGREWILAVGRTWGVEEDRLCEHAERLLELFDLGEQADRPANSYSTGQKKKLALCGVLASEAPILLLDEPFSGGLDPSGILALKRVLQRRGERGGRTVILSTPVPQLVEELADRVALLHDRRLVAFDDVPGLARLADCDGTFEEVYERLMNPRNASRIDRYFGVAP